jgi:hypothetical protein
MFDTQDHTILHHYRGWLVEYTDQTQVNSVAFQSSLTIDSPLKPMADFLRPPDIG